MERTKYDNSVSIAKGIAIILMVMGHASYTCYLNDFLTIIRMPLFFVMSGYLFKDKYLQNSIDFFKRKVKGIYIPYVKYCLLFLLLHNLFFRVGIYNDSFIDVADVSRLYSTKDFVYRGLRILTSMTHYDRLLGGYWFLHTLFFASLIFYISHKSLRIGYWFQLVSLLVISVILCYFNFYIPYFQINYLPFMAAAMMMFGRVLYQSKWRGKIYIAIIGITLVSLVAYIMPTAMPSCKYYEIIPYTIASLAGTLVIFYLSQYINLNYPFKLITKFLIFVGENTFAILTWHMLSFKFVTLIIIILFKEPYKRLAETLVLNDYVTNDGGWVWVFFYSIIGVFVPLLINQLILFGKKHTQLVCYRKNRIL